MSGTPTNKAEILANIFERLHKSGRELPNSPMIDAWKRMLGSNDNYFCVQTISQICALVDRLRTEIGASRAMSISQKKSAMGTLSAFESVFDIGRLSRPASEFNENLSESNRGYLGLIGHALTVEFPLPRLTEIDEGVISSELLEIRDLLNQSSIDADLKVALQKQVDLMIWWLGNPDAVDLQSLFETLGSSLVVAMQMTRRHSDGATSENAAAKTIWERMTSVGDRIGGLLEVFSKGVEHAEKIGGTFRRMIDF